MQYLWHHQQLFGIGHQSRVGLTGLLPIYLVLLFKGIQRLQCTVAPQKFSTTNGGRACRLCPSNDRAFVNRGVSENIHKYFCLIPLFRILTRTQRNGDVKHEVGTKTPEQTLEAVETAYAK